MICISLGSFVGWYNETVTSVARFLYVAEQAMPLHFK